MSNDTNNNLILKTENLGIMFGGLSAVSNFNIEINSGELVGLIGPNGAGKTTVFNLITGNYRPTTGSKNEMRQLKKATLDTLSKANTKQDDEINENIERKTAKIYLCGKNITNIKPNKRVELGIARTFQNIRLFKKLSVIDNVKTAFNHQMKYSPFSAIFRTRAFWNEERDIDQKAREILAVFGLEGVSEEYAENLPYGKQRKLEIARALATNPKLLLLDEPAAGMNPIETEELMETIRMVKDNFKITILLIEHDMKLVMGICKRIIVLNYGQIIAEGTPKEIQSNPKVITAYLGE